VTYLSTVSVAMGVPNFVEDGDIRTVCGHRPINDGYASGYSSKWVVTVGKFRREVTGDMFYSTGPDSRGVGVRGGVRKAIAAILPSPIFIRTGETGARNTSGRPPRIGRSAADPQA
jgi:hypothetical protein